MLDLNGILYSAVRKINTKNWEIKQTDIFEKEIFPCAPIRRKWPPNFKPALLFSLHQCVRTYVPICPNFYVCASAYKNMVDLRVHLLFCLQ